MDLLKRVRGQLNRIDTDIAKLKEDDKFPAERHEQFHSLRPRFESSLESVIADLEFALKRLSRSTVNIFVSGQARMGKSTFIQTVSGLTDNEVPTGSGLPLTAVRCHILHNPKESFAEVTFHSFESFRESVLSAYHDALDLAPIPGSIEEFRRYPYPVSINDQPSKLTLLERLREMQRYLHTYEDLFDETPLVKTIGEIRPYIVYPPLGDDSTPRYYLAVKEVYIECPFPSAQVAGLGLIDLPGLGEVVPQAEERYVKDLENHADFVIIIKRPVEGQGYWTEQDARLVDLLERARKSITSRRDFVWILINAGGVTIEQVEKLRQEISIRVNQGENDKHYRVLIADVKDQQKVFEKVMLPVLQHLHDRLPIMDSEILSPICRQLKRLVQEVYRYLEKLDTGVKNLMSSVRGPISEGELLFNKAKELREDVTCFLDEIVDEFSREDKSNHYVDRYIDALESCKKELFDWIDHAFGVGKNEWLNQAVRQLRVEQLPDRLILNELHRIRTGIIRELFTLDNLFQRLLTELWDRIGDDFAKHFGKLLGSDKDGKVRLEILTKYLEDAPEPCMTLARAVRQLLSVQIEFRTVIYPELWEQIQHLFLVEFHTESKYIFDRSSPVRPSKEEMAEVLLEFFQSIARKAVDESVNILYKVSGHPRRVYGTIVGVFQDQFIRSEESEKEFNRFVRCYRDLLFPGDFDTPNLDSVGFQQLRNRIGETTKCLKEIENVCGTLQREMK
jgi:hypothetical protein